MVPHYHIFSIPEDYDSMCTDKSGKYCAEDPDGGGPVTGRDVVHESLRQLCIYELTAIPDPANSRGPGSGERRRSWKWWE